MKKKQNGFIVPLVIAIVAVFFIAGGAYVYYINKTPANLTIPTNTTTSATSTISKDGTTGTWKTFGSIPYGFSIQYPEGSVISDGTSTNGHIFIFTTTNGIVTVEVATKANHSGNITSPANCEDTAGGASRTNTTINSDSFVTFDMSKELSGANLHVSATEYCLLQNDTAYKIITEAEYEPGATSLNADKTPALNRMFSSFKLLNKPSANPTITSVTPSSVPLLTGFTITGSNFDPLGGSNSSGWLTHSHVFVLITNSVGKRAILWEGGSQGGNTSTATKISVASIPKAICSVSSTVREKCPSQSVLQLTPGKYKIQVSVNGRNTGNVVPLTITGAK